MQEILQPQPPDLLTVIVASQMHDAVHDHVGALDPDNAPETVTVGVNQPQAVFLALATMLTGKLYPCLESVAIDVAETISQAIREQRSGEEGWDAPRTAWGDPRDIEL